MFVIVAALPSYFLLLFWSRCILGFTVWSFTSAGLFFLSVQDKGFLYQEGLKQMAVNNRILRNEVQMQKKVSRFGRK